MTKIDIAIVSSKILQQTDIKIIAGCLSRLTNSNSITFVYQKKVKDIKLEESNSYQAIGEYASHVKQLVSYYDLHHLAVPHDISTEEQQARDAANKALFAEALEMLIESGNPEDMVYVFKNRV